MPQGGTHTPTQLEHPPPITTRGVSLVHSGPEWGHSSPCRGHSILNLGVSPRGGDEGAGGDGFFGRELGKRGRGGTDGWRVRVFSRFKREGQDSSNIWVFEQGPEKGYRRLK